MAVNARDHSVFYSTNYSLIVWFEVFDCLQHSLKAKYVFCAQKVVADHNEVHFSIYFLQAFEKRVGVTLVAFYGAEGMLADGLPPFVIMRHLFNVAIVDVHRVLVLASMYDAFGKFGTLVL